jgi:hypothetical protein
VYFQEVMLERIFSHRNLVRMAIGAGVTFLGLVITLGGIEVAAGLLLISIVCTLGVSLVVWLPIFWAIGWLVLGFLKQ